MKSIILASGSPRRKKLLEQINLTFTVEPGSADESFDPGEKPSSIVQSLALRKGDEIAPGKPESLIISADTIVVFNNKILGKPESVTHAREMLASLSGQVHQVLTGVALMKTDKEGNIHSRHTFFEETHVLFGPLTSEEIEQYVQSGSPMDKAGAYGIQDDRGALFVERIEGDYYNVVGLPLHAFYQQMKTFAPEYLAEDY